MDKKLIRPLLFLVGLLFIVALMIHSWDKLRVLLIKLDWFLFILSILVSGLCSVFISLFFNRLLHKYGVEVDYTLTHKIFFYGQIAKYIPGKIWVVLYQTTLVNQLNATSALLFANIDLMVLLILIMLMVAISLILFNYSVILAIVCFFIGLLICVWIGKSCYLFKVVRHLFSYHQRLSETLCTCHEQLSSLEISLFYSIVWITYLIANFLMMYAVFNFPIAESANYIAYLGIAWIVGTLSLIVPGGMGIKELAFVMLAHALTADISLETLTAIAVISRFWISLQELLTVGTLFLWTTYRERSI